MKMDEVMPFPSMKRERLPSFMPLFVYLDGSVVGATTVRLIAVCMVVCYFELWSDF